MVLKFTRKTDKKGIRDRDLSSCNRSEQECGREGKYRRTSSPSFLPAPDVRPSAQQATNVDKMAPKNSSRMSPATIAAKGAPGWEKFLGGKTSTVLFTSEEAERLKTKKPFSQPPPEPVVPSKPRTSANGLLETSFESDRLMVPEDPITTPGSLSKSNPSLNVRKPDECDVNSNDVMNGRKTLSSGKMSTALPAHLVSSLESLGHSTSQDATSGPGRGFTAVDSHGNGQGVAHVVSHSHSNSDSGLSSLSGRTSTMSPISTMSTVSSVSSTSSSGSSSRASLRSASIVSSCTIPLDEEEEMSSSMNTSPSGTIQTKIKQYRVARDGEQKIIIRIFKMAEELQLETLFNNILSQRPQKRKPSTFSLGLTTTVTADLLEGLLNCKIGSQLEESEKLSTECRFESREQIKSEMIKRLNKLSERLLVKQAELRNEGKCNDELGRKIQVNVMQLASPSECDKYKLHVEETDKITSLLLGLCGRLTRAEHAIGLMTDPAEKETAKSKRDKLLDQLEEAKKLRQNIRRKSLLVAKTLEKYLSVEHYEDYKTFIATKTKLVIESRLVNDRISLANEQIKSLDEI